MFLDPVFATTLFGPSLALVVGLVVVLTVMLVGDQDRVARARVALPTSPVRHRNRLAVQAPVMLTVPGEPHPRAQDGAAPTTQTPPGLVTPSAQRRGGRPVPQADGVPTLAGFIDALDAGHGLFDWLYETSEQPMLVCDADDLIIDANDVFALGLGQDRRRLRGLALTRIVAPIAGAMALPATRTAAVDAGHWNGEMWFRCRTGEPVSISVARVALRDPRGALQGFLVVGRAFGSSGRDDAAASWRANHDPLTKLPNRTLLRQRLADAIMRSRLDDTSGVLLSLDLDRFKQINDTLGLAVGDQLLVHVAHRLALAVNEGDTVARVGSDEFAVIIPDLDGVDEAERQARRLLDTLARPFMVEGIECAMSATMGVAVFPADGDSSDEVIRNADAAMHGAKAKGDGGQCRFYEKHLDEASARRVLVERHLRTAIRNNQLSLHYQPILAVDGSEVVGAEALCRWEDPELGVVSPGEFIPIAESSGLILPLGLTILEEACRQRARWVALGLPPIRVNVNVSNRQLQSSEDVDVLLEAIRRHDPQWLTIEITESLLMRDADLVARFIDEARALGVKIALDDFGTGYSALSCLRNYAIDVLKIDKSFIDHIETNTEDLSIVATIISMGRTLGMRTVAEGVENEGQVNYLRTLGCDRIQGYHFCRPLPSEALVEYLRSRADG